MRGQLGRWSRVAGWGVVAMFVATLLAAPAAFAQPSDEPCAPQCADSPRPGPSATSREDPKPEPSAGPTPPPATPEPPEPSTAPSESPAPRPTATSDQPRPTNSAPIEAPPALPPIEAPPLPTLSPPLPTLLPTVTSPTPSDPGPEPPSSPSPSTTPTWTWPVPPPPVQPAPFAQHPAPHRNRGGRPATDLGAAAHRVGPAVARDAVRPAVAHPARPRRRPRAAPCPRISGARTRVVGDAADDGGVDHRDGAHSAAASAPAAALS